VLIFGLVSAVIFGGLVLLAQITAALSKTEVFGDLVAGVVTQDISNVFSRLWIPLLRNCQSESCPVGCSRARVDRARVYITGYSITSDGAGSVTRQSAFLDLNPRTARYTLPL